MYRTKSGLNGAAWFSAVLDLGPSFALGLKTGYSNNFSVIETLELAALGRWYFISVKGSRLFAQLEAGADLIFYNGERVPAFLGGLAAGWRVALGSWYLEPVLRCGYPFVWGAGLGFGLRI